MSSCVESGAFMAAELRAQPDTWARTLEMPVPASALPAAGERVAVIGCGSSWFGGRVFAALREGHGLGETDAFTASDVPLGRDYDRLIAISRSGTTTEVVDVLDRLAEVRGGASRIRTTAIVAEADSPIGARADDVIALTHANEHSVVQTGFGTSTIMGMRSWLGLGEDLRAVIDEARAVLDGVSADFTEFDPAVLDDELIDAEQFSFIGRDWTWGLADEAALKLRESAQAWTETYNAMEYRHGPISIAAPGRVTWQFGPAPEGLAAQVDATGARFVTTDRDPVADLVRIHVLSLARARRLGVDPDSPRSLSRSVILD